LSPRQLSRKVAVLPFNRPSRAPADSELLAFALTRASQALLLGAGTGMIDSLRSRTHRARTLNLPRRVPCPCRPNWWPAFFESAASSTRTWQANWWLALRRCVRPTWASAIRRTTLIFRRQRSGLRAFDPESR
jgi:hypothetical protein